MLKLNHLTGFGSGAAAAVPGDVTSYAGDDVKSYLSIPDHADWVFGSGSFTIEFWVYLNDASAQQGFVNSFTNSTNLWTFNQGVYGTGLVFVQYESNVQTILIEQGAVTLVTGVWTHIALVRNGNDYNIYIDGTSVASGTDATAVADFSGGLFIGSVEGALYNNLDGYMDEIRVSDTARYTTGFTPSSTQFTSDANTVLLIHGGEAYTAPLTGETTQSCVAFDGVNDYLAVGDHADWNLSSGNFTMECWLKLNDLTDGALITQYDNTSGNKAFIFQFHNTPGIRFTYSTDGSNTTLVDWSWSPTVGVWYHVAVVRNGTDLDAYINGVPLSTTHDISTSALYDSGQDLRVGVYFTGGSTPNGDLNGSVAEVRLSDTARWTADFSSSLPTERYTSDANTLLLIHGDENGGGTAAFTDSGDTGHTVTPTGDAFLGNGGTFTDSGNTGHTVSENGQAQKETEQEFKLADDGVGYFFDGTGDYLSIPDHADWNLTGDHTIECFIRLPDVSAHDDMIYAQVLDGNNRRHLSITSDGTINYYCKESSTFLFQVYTGAGEISDNTWYHVAVVRDGDDYYTYVDGVSKSVSGSPDSSNPSGIAAPLRIGTYAAATEWLGGYIDELRVSDTCRYPDGTTFAPTTTQFVSDANTLLLIHGGEAKSGTTGSGATFTDSGDTGHTVTENGNAIESTGNFYKF